eukprot:923500-Amphidinium_carterae.2
MLHVCLSKSSYADKVTNSKSRHELSHEFPNCNQVTSNGEGNLGQSCGTEATAQRSPCCKSLVLAIRLNSANKREQHAAEVVVA